MRKERGFTLIELLLALAIFTLIAIATTRTLQQVQNTKNQAFEDLDLFSETRTAISVLRSDLTQAFHVLFEDLSPDAQTQLQQARQVPHTIFDGRKNELIFTSLSHRVYYQGKRESEQTEISYFLQARPKSKFSTLMKREGDRIDADLYQGGPVYTLLENVEELQFQYWNPKTKKWVDDWNSDGGDTRDTFPPSVRVRLVVTNPNGKKLVVDTQLKVGFPNNENTVAKFQ